VSGNTYQITPFMQAVDFDAALRFFIDALGFEAKINHGGYAYLEREGAGMRILQNTDAAEQGAPHRGFAYYIDVRDLGIVQQQIGARLAELPEGHVVGPVDQPYGQRELMIRAPDGNVLVFGQAIEPAAS
jgi:catechol 2,3-dioxygenase-like lactoylglutathione lyase family enzyme